MIVIAIIHAVLNCSKIMRYVTVLLTILVRVSLLNWKYPQPLSNGVVSISLIKSLTFILVSSSHFFENILNGLVNFRRLEWVASAVVVTE